MKGPHGRWLPRRTSVSDPARIDWAPNWYGGFYELSIRMGPRSDERLTTALLAVWRFAGVQGCYALPEVASGDMGRVGHIPVSLGPDGFGGHGHLMGVVRLPSGVDVVCGAVAVRLDAGIDWLDFYIPLGALGQTDKRVGGFPFGHDGGPESLEWRRPIDSWLADVGSRVAEVVPFEFARIGFEASGDIFPSEECFGRLVPQGGTLGYVAAER